MNFYQQNCQKNYGIVEKKDTILYIKIIINKIIMTINFEWLKLYHIQKKYIYFNAKYMTFEITYSCYFYLQNEIYDQHE